MGKRTDLYKIVIKFAWHWGICVVEYMAKNAQDFRTSFVISLFVWAICLVCPYQNISIYIN